jgi:hypothetical protein
LPCRTKSAKLKRTAKVEEGKKKTKASSKKNRGIDLSPDYQVVNINSLTDLHHLKPNQMRERVAITIPASIFEAFIGACLLLRTAIGTQIQPGSH